MRREYHPNNKTAVSEKIQIPIYQTQTILQVINDQNIRNYHDIELMFSSQLGTVYVKATNPNSRSAVNHSRWIAMVETL